MVAFTDSARAEVKEPVDVRVVRDSVLDVETPLLVVGVYEDQTELTGTAGSLDRALNGRLTRLRQQGEISGKRENVTVVHVDAEQSPRAERIAVIGLGARADVDLESLRVAAALAARRARELHLDSCAFAIDSASVGSLSLMEAARVTTEAALLALYRYERFKVATRSEHDLASLTLVAVDPAQAEELEKVASLGVLTCDAISRTRDLSVGPGNFVTPTYLAEQAEEVAADCGLEITVWGADELRERGMNGILAVNQGSVQPPRFVVMRYRAEGATRTLAVVGKGITFDSGGISLKPPEHMEYMRHDMTGAATVIGFMQLAARSRLPVHVTGIFAATENLPSGSSYKPGDVFTASNGKTMEIVNTDAEGRVILSDALVFAASEKPDAIVDLATLTGACRVALGNHATGLMTNSQPLADALISAGEIAGDRCWQLPMWPVYREQIKTVMADVRNTGGPRAGAITAAFFLKEFVGDVPWAHLDIAGTAYTDPQQTYIAPYNPRYGATGVGVRLLWHFCHAWKDN